MANISKSEAKRIGVSFEKTKAIPAIRKGKCFVCTRETTNFGIGGFYCGCCPVGGRRKNLIDNI